jgi:hypothetical protein
MVSVFAFNRGDEGDAEEIDLASPDDSERDNLGRHVDRCAKRYRLISLRQRATRDDIQQLKYLIYGIGALIAATSGPGQHVIGKLLGIE